MKEAKKYSHTRLGSIAITKVFLETLKMRLKRIHQLDPWA